MNKTQHYNWLFRLAFKIIKYFSLILFGFTVASLISAVFGAFPIVEFLMALLWQWFWRVAVIIFSLIAGAVIVESLQ